MASKGQKLAGYGWTVIAPNGAACQWTRAATRERAISRVCPWPRLWEACERWGYRVEYAPRFTS